MAHAATALIRLCQRSLRRAPDCTTCPREGPKKAPQRPPCSRPTRAALAASTGSGLTCDFSSGTDVFCDFQWFTTTDPPLGGAFPWTPRTGGTPSPLTGPSAGPSGGSYIYIEASGNTNDAAFLYSMPGQWIGIQFKYHMCGSDMGTVSVDGTNDGVTWTNVWVRSGQQHASEDAPWSTAQIAFEAPFVQMRFTGIVGSSWRSDAAVADVVLVSGLLPAPPPESPLLDPPPPTPHPPRNPPPPPVSGGRVVVSGCCPHSPRPQRVLTHSAHSPILYPPPPPQGRILRAGTSEMAAEAVGQAVGGVCQSGWGPLLSVTNAVEAGTWRQGDSGWALAGRLGGSGGGGCLPPFQCISAPSPPCSLGILCSSSPLPSVHSPVRSASTPRQHESISARDIRTVTGCVQALICGCHTHRSPSTAGLRSALMWRCVFCRYSGVRLGLERGRSAAHLRQYSNGACAGHISHVHGDGHFDGVLPWGSDRRCVVYSQGVSSMETMRVCAAKSASHRANNLPSLSPSPPLPLCLPLPPSPSLSLPLSLSPPPPLLSLCNTGCIVLGCHEHDLLHGGFVGLLVSAEPKRGAGEGAGGILYHTEPTVRDCTLSSSINRPKDVSGCPAAPEECSFTAFLASFSFAVLIVCVCVCMCVCVCVQRVRDQALEVG